MAYVPDGLKPGARVDVEVPAASAAPRITSKEQIVAMATELASEVALTLTLTLALTLTLNTGQQDNSRPLHSGTG